MRSKCIHWTFRPQCQEQPHRVKQRGGLPKEKQRAQFSLRLFTSLLLLCFRKRTLPFPSHLTWINWWENASWLMKTTISYKVDFDYATLWVLSCFLSLSTSWCAFSPPFEPLSLFYLTSFSPVCCLSFSSIFLPLLLSVVLPSHHPLDCFFLPPSVAPSTLCFVTGAFLPHLDSLPLTHLTALISTFSLLCFCCSRLDTCGVIYRTSETTVMGQQEKKHWEEAGRWDRLTYLLASCSKSLENWPSNGSSAFPSLLCRKDACPLCK